MRLRRIGWGVLWGLGALVLGACLAYATSGEFRYLVRGTWEEAGILWSARPIAAVLRDSALPERERAQLRLVVQARDYAATLGFKAGDTYTTFSQLPRDTLLLVLSAAPRNCLCPYTWHYPVVGTVPYKGFFDFAMARSAAADLARQGYDINLRPADAFSTLGWFNDPLLSTALDRDSVELAATVFHEIAHNTLWVPSAIAFNESFAQFAGYHAAASFFRARGDTALARRSLDRWHDEIVLGGFYGELVGRLQQLYGSNVDSAAVDSGRAAVGAWARAQLEGPVGDSLKTYRIGPMANRPVNNARLIGVLLYRTGLPLFDDWYQRHGGDLTRSVAGLRDLLHGVPGDSAFARLAGAMGDSVPAAGLPAGGR